MSSVTQMILSLSGGLFMDSSPRTHPFLDPGTPYYGLSGALKCLSEGSGQIAFLKDNTISDYCPEEEIDQRRIGA